MPMIPLCCQRLAGLLVAGALALCADVAGACAVTGAAAADFGAAGSIAVRTGTSTTSTTNAGLQCADAAAQPWAGGASYFRVAHLAGTSLTGPDGDTIDYQLFVGPPPDAAFLLQQGDTADLLALGVIDSLGLLQGGATRSVPVYLRTVAGSNVTAGSYSTTVALRWEWQYCIEADGSGGCSRHDTGSGNSMVPVTLQVQNDCIIDAGDIAFGSAPAPEEFAAVNASMAVTCTKGSAYTVGIGEGQNAIDGGRRMRSDDGAFLAYEVFQGSGTTPWGHIGASRRASSTADVNPGDGLGTSAQRFNYSARVLDGQAAVPVGTYVDVLVVDVAF